jgi:hypothetical protein
LDILDTCIQIYETAVWHEIWQHCWRVVEEQILLIVVMATGHSALTAKAAIVEEVMAGCGDVTVSRTAMNRPIQARRTQVMKGTSAAAAFALPLFLAIMIEYVL